MTFEKTILKSVIFLISWSNIYFWRYLIKTGKHFKLTIDHSQAYSKFILKFKLKIYKEKRQAQALVDFKHLWSFTASHILPEIHLLLYFCISQLYLSAVFLWSFTTCLILRDIHCWYYRSGSVAQSRSFHNRAGAPWRRELIYRRFIFTLHAPPSTLKDECSTFQKD